MRSWVCALLLVLGLAHVAHAQQQAPQAVPVGTVAAEKRPVEKTTEFVGRAQAIDKVTVVARVKGYLDAVLFKEGDLVKEGDPLYQIEPGPFEAALQQAEGALERSKAAQALSAVQLTRAQELLRTQAGSVVARDQALAADDSAKANIVVSEAELKNAKINLGYTKILSPINGRIGRTNVTKGNVVGPDSGPLTIIVSQDPMYVTFPVSQREFLRAQETNTLVDLTKVKVRLHFSDGSTYGHEGTVNFVDVTVDQATDTVLARADFPNPDRGLIDGQLVRVVLASASPEEKIVIPQAALIADQEGVYVFVVEDGKAAVKRIKTGGASGTDIVVESGLNGGEQVIVEGTQALRVGMPVQATPMPPAIKRS
jgi:membrane fusion protein (multidrug efflux system)